ncbi:hypothetical protein BABINDRAFT_26988, partial [Babjeviella inositovora NRRL Y-12698]
ELSEEQNDGTNPVSGVYDQSSRLVTEEDQQLAKKLKETYKNIIRLEEQCQKGCLEINTKLYHQEAVPTISQDLWTLYHVNVGLLDSYYDFLLCALRPLASKTGRQIVNVYKIPRRLWVYGIVGFLEVLKNVVNVFMEHEICACFISYAFNILAALTDTSFDMQGWWAEKLGDLSRMAIALYPSRFIDWKVSSETWYALAMKTQFGHGKIYYHMLTVQQDNLDALVNIGKSVTCRDPFVPTAQYLRLVVENICNQRNVLTSVELPTIDFIKIHKILLMPTYPENPEMVLLVSRYLRNFGVDPQGLNFFSNPHALTLEKLTFWFAKGAHFALANLTHVAGFGDTRNPFARLFALPEALKERKEKKERKRKSRDDTRDDALSVTEDPRALSARDMNQLNWFECLEFVNKGALELAVRMLDAYLSGPTSASTTHIIVWLYFLVALGEAANKHASAKLMVEYFVAKFVPWDAFINYLNDLLYDIQHKPALVELAKFHNSSPEVALAGGFLNYYNHHETLPEVFKCWGTLWFDFVDLKTDYTSAAQAGLLRDIFDTPGAGSKFAADEEPERLVRILLLAKFVADTYNFGLIRDEGGFKFSADSYKTQAAVEAQFGTAAAFARDLRIAALPGPVTSLYVGRSGACTLTPTEKDALWLVLGGSRKDEDEDDGYESETGAAGDIEDEDEDDEAFVAPGAAPDDMGDMGDRVDSRVTHITLDTNIWLKHCGRIFKCIRAGILRISIPLTVFQELRLLRRSQDGAVCDAATRAVITVRELNSEGRVVPLRFDGTVASSLNEITEFENNGNWRSNIDQMVLTAVREHDEMGRRLLKGNGVQLAARIMTAQEAAELRYCVLVTDDRNMRLRAKTVGVVAYHGKWLFSQIEHIAEGRCTD